MSLETWHDVFENNYVNSIYNFSLNTYQGVFYSSFPLRKLITKTNGITWITTGLRISCKHKREMYLLRKNSNDPLLKNYYKLYCKILSNVIKEAKKYYFNKWIKNSKNKMKTIWDITKSLTRIKTKNKDVQQLNINGNINYNLQTIPDSFNKYFLSTTEKNHSAFNKNNNFVDHLI